ncbi:MAG: stage II sporulation protein M [Chloroflexi bacterium]|nr:stage II sporulation protein M [Chloroflexota bacterium]
MLKRQRLRWLGTAVCDSHGAPRDANSRFTLIRVYAQDIPALLEYNRWLMLFTAGFFFVGIVAGAALGQLYPLATESLLRVYAEQVERLGDIESISTAAILGNNLRILLLSPILATLTFGLYPLIVVTLPGVLLGMLAVQVDFAGPFQLLIGLVLVLPHGVFEIPAIMIGSALSLRLAWSFLRPVPSLSFFESVAWAAINVIKGYVFLVIPLIVIAAWVEVNVTGQIARWLIGLSAIITIPQP